VAPLVASLELNSIPVGPTSLLSSIHILLVKILWCVRLYIINENIINTVCSGIFGYNIEIKPSLHVRLGVYNEPSSGCRKLDEVGLKF